jgi:Ca2+-binding RTX toxin-like protein
VRCKTLLAVGAALVWMLQAELAFGATVGVFEEPERGEVEVRYEATLGEINDLTVVEAPENVYLFTDVNAVITPLAGCTSISPMSARCEVNAELFDRAVVFTKDGADRVDAASEGAFVRGGPGSDTLTSRLSGSLGGGFGDDFLVGLTGRQGLHGGGGADRLDGGIGDDFLDGGPGTDVIAGGPGRDMVDYFDTRAPVRITLDGRANDGAAGENDWVQADVESASGSTRSTTFIGNAGPNEFVGWSRAGDAVRAGAGDDSLQLWFGPDLVSAGGGDDLVDDEGGRDVITGGPGDDKLHGYDGADLILGGRGDDVLTGGRGDDELRGGRGNDRLSGGRRNDTLRGGPGHDRLFGELGDDILYARDRTRDIVLGGFGHDRAHVDPLDGLFSVEGVF